MLSLGTKTEYAETSVFGMFKEYIGGPVFAALGNHDSNPEVCIFRSLTFFKRLLSFLLYPGCLL